MLVIGGLVLGGAIIGAASQYISDVIDNYATGERGWSILKPRSPVEDYIASAAGGAVGLPLGVAAGVNPFIAGAAGGAVKSLVQHGLKEHRLPTPKEYILDVTIGALPGVLTGAATPVGSKATGVILKQAAQLGIKADARLLAWIAASMLLRTEAETQPSYEETESRRRDFVEALNEVVEPDRGAGAPVTVYSQITQRLQQAGFNPANPQLPPSGSK